LAGTWKVSGVIPAMVYYGINFIDPSIFLPLTLLVTAIVSLTAGSSYITSATIGVALVSVGNAFGISPSMTAGAVISGAYFGDKMSPLSDTTNLASAISGTDLYTHIKYMMYTTFPTFIITFIVFCIITLNLSSYTSNDANEIGLISEILNEDFYISPLLFAIPGSVLILAYLKVKPVIALSVGVLFAIIFSVIFQSNILEQIDISTSKAILSSVFTYTEIPLEVSINENTKLLEGITDLYTRGGMESMLWVILLTTCAMIFGGAMEAIGALNKITNELLKLADSAFGLIASTVASCLGVNLFASDQYLAIIIPGKMFKNAFKENDLAPENLSRTLEDSGTVTSALIPWNTCGAYHYGVLGVSVVDYFVYAIFNWLSPIMTLIYAGIGIKLRSISRETNN
jgi:NhaC family Na+:H+ antiporter